MTTPTNKDHVAFLKSLFFANRTINKCNDDRVSYYRLVDMGNTWEVFNVRAFLSSYNEATYEMLQVSPNPINIFLINLLKALNTIVFDKYSESLFKDKFYQHLDTLMELVYISDIRASVPDTIDVLCKKCNELYDSHPSESHITVKTHICLSYCIEHERDLMEMKVTLTDEVTKKSNILTFNFYF